MTRHHIALVGIGKIALDQHVPALNASADWQLSAAVSRNHALGSVPNYADLDAMLAAHPEIEVVSLCMPPSPRFEYAMAALQADRHVMLEKPPGATVSEVHALEAEARTRGLTLYASWHSRAAACVPAAKAWLADKRLMALKVTWHEDVRKWHPGQDWVFEPGGMGVFDPGINALSIVTEILPDPIHLRSASLDFPANRSTPIAADLRFTHPQGAAVQANFNWDYQGADVWDIEAITDRGTLTLQNGGGTMLIDGTAVSTADGLSGEYPQLYATMARLVAAGTSDVDLRPMYHVSDALTLGARREVAAFDW